MNRHALRTQRASLVVSPTRMDGIDHGSPHPVLALVRATFSVTCTLSLGYLCAELIRQLQFGSWPGPGRWLHSAPSCSPLCVCCAFVFANSKSTSRATNLHPRPNFDQLARSTRASSISLHSRSCSSSMGLCSLSSSDIAISTATVRSSLF